MRSECVRSDVKCVTCGAPVAMFDWYHGATRCTACRQAPTKPAKPCAEEDGKSWKCSRCDQLNSAWANECGRCEYSRHIMRDGKLIDRDPDTRAKSVSEPSTVSNSEHGK